MTADLTPAMLAEDARLHLARGILSYMKHELSQPLGAIFLTTEACAMAVSTGNLDPQQIAEDLQEINRLAEAASKLLAQARDRAGPITADPTLTCANEPLQQLVPPMSADLAKVGIEVELDLAPDLPASLLDPRLLALAVTELLRNAGEALPHGGRVWVRSAASDAGTLAITVIDNGPGTDLTIDKLTEPFFTTREGHLGMGLTLCRTFVEAQGGKLALNQNSDGRSSRFVIQLPSSQAAT